MFIKDPAREDSLEYLNHHRPKTSGCLNRKELPYLTVNSLSVILHEGAALHKVIIYGPLAPLPLLMLHFETRFKPETPSLTG